MNARKILDFKIPEISFDSNLVDIIIKLDYLRKKQLFWTTNPHVFFQLKNIFHILESLWSARIEWNHTTLSDYIESKLENPNSKDENFLEIKNSENAIEFIENNIGKSNLDKLFISEVHKIVTKWLITEWSKNPGEYRKSNVTITKSSHLPPDYIIVDELMEKLIDFINSDIWQKFNLLKIAIFHHNFAWIHPFDNWNWRTVRLITYALLIKYWFNVKNGRIINPTAIFNQDRDKYYIKLQIADSLTNEWIIEWCEYMLWWLEWEIEKIDNLLDYKFLKKNILLPTIDFAINRWNITKEEYDILKILVEKQEIQAEDIKHLFPGKLSASISRYLKWLKDKKMISSINEKSRKYVLDFTSSYLVRGVIKALDENNFISIKD